MKRADLEAQRDKLRDDLRRAHESALRLQGALAILDEIIAALAAEEEGAH